MKRILIATRNKGKLKEFQAAFKSIPLEVIDLSGFPTLPDAEETGKDFRENARLKAIYYSSNTGIAAVADDSGLEVEALGGAPGVHSARYAGSNANDSDRIAKLLAEMADIPEEGRRARFVCSLALADQDGNVLWEDSGICSGRITTAPNGQGGFGYDPVFMPDGFDQTFGELPDGVKLEISHRARAIAKLNAYLALIPGL